ncbi:Phosphatidylinositol-4-phosphate 5-kinase [Lobaria immixta]|nr:Phosphatidylinositol-4-phosphate 5-kinase [Lobaria immixta]
MASSTTQPTDATYTAHYNDCKPASGTFDKASEGANSIQYEDEYEKSNAALQLAWNSRMAEGNYKSPSFYKKVKCLLVSWDKECDDLDTEEEVASLAKVFENRFHFKVTRALLTNDDEHLAHVQVLKYISDFIWAEDAVHTLLLFYYAGHGSPRPLRDGSYGLALTGKCTHYDNAENLNEVVWGHLEDNFQHTKADVLEIFDCCYAGDLGRTRQPWGARSFEFLGACSSGNTTLSPGKGSFTVALIWALEALVEAQTKFTLSELCCKIREAPDFPPDQIPVQYDRGVHTFERIIIAPLPEIGNDEKNAPEGIDDSDPQGLLHLNFFFEEPPSKDIIDNMAKGMNRLVYEQGLPVNRIVWGGLVSWGGAQPSRAGEETTMILKAVKMFRDRYRHKLSKAASVTTGQPSESTSHKPSLSVSDALPQSNANPPPPNDNNILGKKDILVISACLLSVLLTRTHGTVYRACLNLWSRFR